MTTSLKKEFGYVIIPENTLLFRGHESIDFKNCMFFTLKYWVAGAFGKKIQVWVTKKSIEVLFLIKHIDSRAWAFSSIPILYNKLFKEDKNTSYSDLDIKHHNLDKRNKFINELYLKYNIKGWLTSVEENTELEICLFNEIENSKNLSLIKITDSENDEYFKDSLENISIYPSPNFFEQSLKVIRQNSYYNCERETMWEKYESYINFCITDEMKRSNISSLEKAKVYWTDLRTKLKM